jgi:hypothetical protein
MLKKIFLLALLACTGAGSYAQHYRWFKNFDLCAMRGTDTIQDPRVLPAFYIKCSYDDRDSLFLMQTVSHVKGLFLPLSEFTGVSRTAGKTILHWAAGKERDGYTRAIFQKKIFIADSALIVHDTLIYKRTSDHFIRLQLFTNITGDSILFSEITFTITGKKDPRLTTLRSFAHYKSWFSIGDEAGTVLAGTIKPNSNTILVWKEVKGQTFRTDITQSSFNDEGKMPRTLFWLKNSGILY